MFRYFKEYTIAALFVLTFFAAPTFDASAQTQYVPINGGVPGNSVSFTRRATYGATILGMTPAASATDFITITGSATRLVTVERIDCSATSTAVGSEIVNSVLRSTANTGGTSTSLTAVPFDSTDSAATAVVKAYTANPTLGTVVGTPLRIFTINTAPGATANIGESSPAIFDTASLMKPVTLRGVLQSMALNGNAVTFPSGSAVSCSIVWTEQ